MEIYIRQHADLMTKMAPMSIYGKTLLKIFSPAATGLIFFETLYEASETLAIYILLKLLLWVDLDLFYGKVKF